MSNRIPTFLNELDDQPLRRIRCPIHGFIHFSANECRVIDHRLFKRLRYIRQLALTELIYPGASHTRFEHSLGVMEIATRAFDALASKYGDEMHEVFSTVAVLGDKPMAAARQYVRLAGLLHDIGHSSFSHAAEKVVHKDSGHEQLSIAIVKKQELLGGLLNELYRPETSQLVADIIEGGASLAPQLYVLHDLVSGEMDADRTDYLLRDSHHCGVDYGRFDHRRMLECLELERDEAGTLQIALHKDGLHTFEALILARYQMNTQVYYHRLRRIYDLYLEKYHATLAEEQEFTTEFILNNNDITMMNCIFDDADRARGARKEWARRIRDRDHHPLVFETGVDANAEDLRRTRLVLDDAKAKFSDIEFLQDVAAGRIHNLLQEDDQNEEGFKRLSLVRPGSLALQVGSISQVLGKIPRRFQCARIYANIARNNRELREEITGFILSDWRKHGGR